MRALKPFSSFALVTIRITMSQRPAFSPFTLAGTASDDFEFLSMDVTTTTTTKPPPMTRTPEQSLPVPRPMPPAAVPLKPLSAFSKPLPAYHHPHTGLVHGRVLVQPRNRVHPESVHFCLQDTQDKDDLSLHLIAHKEKHRYCIYDGSKGIDAPWDLVAVIQRCEFHNDSVSFALTTTADNTLDACVFFNKPSLIQYALEGAPRQLELGVFTKEGRKLELAQARQVVKDCCKYSESKATSSAYKVVGDSKFLSVFHSLVPYKKEGRKKYGLNLKGRGRGASNKNCQMVNEIGKVTLQMAKFEKGIYSVDFAAPLNAVQAFGFALAQLDL